MRSLLLAASRNPYLNRIASSHGLRLGAARFVAGENLDDFVPIVRRLGAEGFTVASAILGEGVRSADETQNVVREYRELLARIAAEHLPANVALKLTHLGLAIGEALAAANLRVLVDSAEALQNTIRIDMEESAYVDATLRIYRKLREEGRDNIGVVLQAYLYRSPVDLESLLDLRPNLRLVKGAYLEPPSIAYPRKADVDRAYLDLIDKALAAPGYTAIATHDEAAIRHAIATTSRLGLPKRGRFEFQMLYGVRPALQRRLVAEGFAVRIAAPYGKSWYPYFMRRLAERPANVGFIVRSMLRA
jgi:proline dehydrogenase